MKGKYLADGSVTQNHAAEESPPTNDISKYVIMTNAEMAHAVMHGNNTETKPLLEWDEMVTLMVT